MVKISKKASKSTIRKAITQFQTNESSRGFQADKYFGKLVRKLDGVDYQKTLRNETYSAFPCKYSVISEIEVLGWFKISEKEKRFFTSLLSDCRVMELSSEIKRIAIELKQKHKLKVPDAIVAATSIHLGIPLLTFDSDFEIQNLNLLLLDN